jgi:hypothetical protein
VRHAKRAADGCARQAAAGRPTALDRRSFERLIGATRDIRSVLSAAAD